jgi:formylglycine-generating enzyme
MIVGRWKSRVLVLLGSVLACSNEAPRQGQLILHVDTDAVILGDDRAHYFDRVEFSVLGAGDECSNCSRIFPVRRADFEAKRVSIGVPTPAGRSGFRARIRLVHKTEETVAPVHAAIEKIVALPAHGENEVRDVWVFMPTEQVGAPAGTVENPVLPESEPGTSRVGTFPRSGPVPCSKEAPTAEAVCVPGGAFWMARSQSLTAVSPFWIDIAEVSVATASALGATFTPPRDLTAPEFVDPSWERKCTHKLGNTQLPANCIDVSQAKSICERRGGRLPTEAEWEYVATNLGRSKYPWGSDSPACEDAIVGRVATGVEFDFFCTKEDPRAYPLGPAPAPRESDIDPRGRDFVSLADRVVYDLAGNLEEFVADAPVDESSACWRPSGLRVDPRCDEAPLPGYIGTRGGSYELPRASGIPIARRSASAFAVGVRCVYDGR